MLNSPYKYTDPLGLLPAKGCNFECRVTNAINGKGNLSEADLELVKFHIRNGSALGYRFLNASYAAISRPQAQDGGGQQHSSADRRAGHTSEPAGDAHEQGVIAPSQTGPVVVVNGNPLQRTANGGLSILLDKDAAKAISLMTSRAIDLEFEIEPDTTITLDLLDDGGFSVSATKPIKIDYTGPIDIRLSKVTFDKQGSVTSTEATYPIGPLDLNVSSAVRKEINKTIRATIYGEGLGAVIDPLPQIVRKASASLYGRRGPPLILNFRAQKKR